PCRATVRTVPDLPWPHRSRQGPLPARAGPSRARCRNGSPAHRASPFRSREPSLDPCLSSLELRRSLREERRDALVQIVAVEDLLLRAGRERKTGIERQILSGVDELLGKPVRKRAARSDSHCELSRSIERR